jgi:nucleoside-diphosphate-sugar epimerase
VLDLVKELNDILGTSIQPTFGPTRTGDVRYSRADITQARKDLGYEPDVSFRAGLEKTVAAMREVAASR